MAPDKSSHICLGSGHLAALQAQDVAIKMRDRQVSSVLVIDDKDGSPIGIVTERDLSRKVCSG